MRRTTFTVAIPTHSRRELAVLAARSALRQTRPFEQVMVLCDGCTDGTQEAMRALGDERVQVLDLPKAAGYGYGHRNRALEQARSDVVMWLGDDDLLTPDHLELVGERWDAGDVDLVQARATLVHPDGRHDRMSMDWNEPQYRELLLSGTHNRTPMAAVSIRRELGLAVGGWDGTLPRWADWDLWKRALRAGARHAMLLQPTVLHFQATGRDQSYEQRVRQNTDHYELIGTRVGVARLRSRVARDWAAAESWLERVADERQAWIDELQRSKDWLEDAYEQRGRYIEKLERDLGAEAEAEQRNEGV